MRRERDWYGKRFGFRLSQGYPESPRMRYWLFEEMQKRLETMSGGLWIRKRIRAEDLDDERTLN